jgi:hypothetical protein
MLNAAMVNAKNSVPEYPHFGTFGADLYISKLPLIILEYFKLTNARRRHSGPVGGEPKKDK